MTGKLGFRCKSPRCSALCTGSDRYCEKHAHEAPPRKFAKNLKRLPLYDSSRWKTLRLMKLRRAPVCEVCKREPATIVHHIKRAREFPELQLVMSNLQSICESCHAAESQKESIDARTLRKEPK